MKKIIYFIAFLCPFLMTASPGDTTEVLAMNKMDLTWYGAYKDTAQFPDSSLRYRKIYMEVTVGCASSGCSDWDYTVKIEARKINDISLPDVFELGRFITPYGGYMANGGQGFNNNWQHTLIYDVTDFEQLLRDSVEIIAFYSGWSSGFSATVKFVMIEGTPTRDVIKFENLYRGTWNSDNPDTFEVKATPPLSIPINSETDYLRAKITPSGHGFINAQNCAEFCERNYYLKTDNEIRFTQSMWRDDCGLNPIYPQAGTWLYDRANWCPGGKAFAYNHELTPFFIAGQNLNIDLDFEIYPLTVPSGETPPNYILDAQLFQYGSANFTLDAEITQIISPSTKDDFSRKNPICGKPIIEIANNGTSTLNSLTITYGVKGDNKQTFNWTGNLPFLTSEIIELDIIENWNNETSVFEVLISAPNGMIDEYEDNNYMKSTFDTVPLYPNKFVIETVTNAQPNDNEWRIFNSEGNEIYFNEMYGVYNSFSDTIILEKGCYEFLLTDLSKNGLYFPFNNDGAGLIAFRSAESKQQIHKDFTANFGTEIRHQFRVGENTLQVNKTLNQPQIKIHPNPASNELFIDFTPTNNETYCTIFNVLGELVYSKQLPINKKSHLNINHLQNGTYIVVINSKDVKFNDKLTIVK